MILSRTFSKLGNQCDYLKKHLYIPTTYLFELDYADIKIFEVCH